jgi:predicted branched-subunit amino acid permease
MILSSTTPFTFFSTLFFVNLRHLLMSFYLARKLPHISTPQALIIGNHITDESFAVASVQAKYQTTLSFPWMCALNTTAYTNWFLANIAGALAGNLIPPVTLSPLKFSLVAMFIGLLAQNIHASETPTLSTLVAAISALLVIPLTLLFGPHQSLIPASLIAASCGLLLSYACKKIRAKPCP